MGPHTEKRSCAMTICFITRPSLIGVCVTVGTSLGLMERMPPEACVSPESACQLRSDVLNSLALITMCLDSALQLAPFSHRLWGPKAA